LGSEQRRFRLGLPATLQSEVAQHLFPSARANERHPILSTLSLSNRNPAGIVHVPHVQSAQFSRPNAAIQQEKHYGFVPFILTGAQYGMHFFRSERRKHLFFKPWHFDFGKRGNA
jgi:hypothetical protein